MDIPEYVNWIDAQIARLQKIRDLATDLEGAALLKVLWAPSSEDMTNGHSRPLKLKDLPPRGYLTKAVEAAALQQEGWFTGYELIERMRTDGFRFVSATPGIGVVEILWKMVAKGLLEIGPGSGSPPHPNRYRRANLPDTVIATEEASEKKGQ